MSRNLFSNGTVLFCFSLIAMCRILILYIAIIKLNRAFIAIVLRICYYAK